MSTPLVVSLTGPVGMKPIRLKVSDAAGVLRIHPGTMRALVASGIFSVIAGPGGRGQGRRYFLHTDEVEIYGTEGEVALRNYRIKKGRLAASEGRTKRKSR